MEVTKSQQKKPCGAHVRIAFKIKINRPNKQRAWALANITIPSDKHNRSWLCSVNRKYVFDTQFKSLLNSSFVLQLNGWSMLVWWPTVHSVLMTTLNPKVMKYSVNSTVNICSMNSSIYFFQLMNQFHFDRFLVGLFVIVEIGNDLPLVRDVTIWSLEF